MVSKKIGVIYLVWLPYGVALLERFLKSYNSYQSGAEHDLIILFNGTAHVDKAVVSHFQDIIKNSGVSVKAQIFSETGQDIKVYRAAAAQVNVDYILFLNSYSQIKNDQWLAHFVINMDKETGVVGATASYASYVRSINNKYSRMLKENRSLSKLFRELKYVLKLNVFLKSKFGRFPNPHIRTNALFVSKEIFLSLDFGNINVKHDAYYFENGKNSMTNQILKMGLSCKVVDKFGRAFDISEAKQSNTFWINNQENLLISDNQTDSYTFGDTNTREALKYDAWGK